VARQFSFARRERLTRAADFRSALTSPCQARDALFILRAHRRSDRERARLGLAVSRRAAPKAWQRNELKRAIRESFRHHKAELQGVDIVVLVTNKAVTAGPAERRKSLERLWCEVAEKCKSS